MPKWIEWRGAGARILTKNDDSAIQEDRHWRQAGEVIKVTDDEAEFYQTYPGDSFVVHESDPRPQRERAGTSTLGAAEGRLSRRRAGEPTEENAQEP